MHLGQVVTVGALRDELRITEGAFHDGIGHDGVVARPAEGQDGARVCATAAVAIAAASGPATVA